LPVKQGKKEVVSILSKLQNLIQGGDIEKARRNK